jgi:hypothetical protein
MKSVYHIVTIRVNETSWAHVWRLCSRYLGTGYDSYPTIPAVMYTGIVYGPPTDSLERYRMEDVH